MLVLDRKPGQRVRVTCQETGKAFWLHLDVSDRLAGLVVFLDDPARNFEFVREEAIDDREPTPLAARIKALDARRPGPRREEEGEN